MKFGLVFLLTSLLSAQAAEPVWKFERVDTAGRGARKTGVKRGTDGRIHVAYTGCSDIKCAGDALAYAVRSPEGRWTTKILDSYKNDTGWFPTIEVKSDGTPHIFYANHLKHKLRYAHATKKGVWTLETLSQNWGGWWNTSAIYNDTIYMGHTRFPESHLDASVLEIGTLRSTNSNLTRDSWSYDTISQSVESGWMPSMTVDKEGQPVVSYLDLLGYPFGNLKVAYRKNGAWEIEDVDGPALKSGIVVDSKGFFHVVYQKPDPLNVAVGDLRYATNAPDGRWKKSMIDDGNGSEGDTGLHPYLSIDANDGLHVTYRDFVANTLMYARNQGNGWEKSVLDDQGQSGFYSSSFIGPDGELHVVFIRSEQLFYASCKTCTTTP